MCCSFIYQVYISGSAHVCLVHCWCVLTKKRNSTRQLADFRESSVESLQTICGNIAGYLRNLCTYLQNDPLRGCRGTFEGDCTAIYARFTIPEDDFADSQRRFCGLNDLRSPKHRLEDSHKMNPWAPERQFRGFPKDDSADPERRFRGLATDDSWISAQTFKEVREFPHRLSQKSAMDYRRSLRISISNLWHVPYTGACHN